MSTHHSRTLLTTALGLILTGSTLAEVTTGYYINNSNYAYQLSEMPDFDQRRNTLPASLSGVPGGMYCVPTACTNLLTYMSTHGVPAVGPAFADWENEENYGDITRFIRNLGDDMGTTGTGGTSGIPAYVEMYKRVVWPTGFRYIVGYEFRNSSNVVTLEELTRSAVFNDAIQTVCYGRYDTLGTMLGSTVIQRTGGHCMTFTGSERLGSDRHMWANDPVDSLDASTQSTFGADDWDTPWVGNLRVANSLVNSLFVPVQGMNRVMRGSADQFRFIDSRIVIMPVGLNTWGDWDGDTSSIIGTSWSPIEAELDTTILARVPFPIAGALQMPFGDTMLIERDAEGFARLWRQSAEQGGYAPVQFVDDEGPDFLDFAISKDLGILALGADGVLYEFPGDLEAVINPDSMRVALDGLQGYDRLAVDPTSGTVAITHTREGFMKLADRYLEDVGTHDIRFIASVSDQVPQVFGDFDLDGRPDMIALGHNHVGDQSVNLLRFEGQQVQISEITNQFIDLVPGQNTHITGLATDDSGAVLLGINGRVEAFKAVGEGAFVPTPDHLFAGAAATKGLVVSRSFTNHDPRLHDTEGWKLQLDESDACPDDDCGLPGDLNGDNVVNGQDLGTLLAAWDTDSEIADLDGDGRVGGPDLAILLGAYGN